MAHPPSRDVTPATGDEWRRLGFYHELDLEQRVWRLVGSRAGLIGLARLVARYADTAAPRPDAPPLPLGPYDDLRVRIWERPGIDDESVYGSPGDLRRLARLIEGRVSEAEPGAKVAIGPEYAGDVECPLVLEIMGADFDPARVVPAVPTGEAAAGWSDAPRPVAFTFHGTESRGVVRLDGTDLAIQYEKKDFAAAVAKIKELLFGDGASNVREVSLPLRDVARVRFGSGVFGANLTVQVKNIRVLEGVPTTKPGVMRLRFQRSDREDAAELATAIDERLADSRW